MTWWKQWVMQFLIKYDGSVILWCLQLFYILTIDLLITTTKIVLINSRLCDPYEIVIWDSDTFKKIVKSSYFLSYHQNHHRSWRQSKKELLTLILLVITVKPFITTHIFIHATAIWIWSQPLNYTYQLYHH